MDDRRDLTSPLDEPLPDPHRVLWIGGIGAGLVVLAALFGLMEASAGIDGPRVVLTLLGLLLAGCALSMRPAWLPAWGIAVASSLFAGAGFPSSWDTFRLLAGVFAGLAILGILLLKLSPRGRLIFAAGAILFHFLGITTAITVSNGQPWLFAQLWARVYRPYLQFAHQTSSYQFFAPDPGAPSELWFCIEYDTADREKQFDWLVVPRRSDSRDPLEQSYYRRIIIPEQAAYGSFANYLPDSEAREVRALRDEAPIPRHPDVTATRQFIIPNNSVQRLVLPSYVRHVAGTHRREETPIKSIKVYRVLHDFTTPEQFVGVPDENGKKTRRITPYDPVTYLPYYLGTYDSAGNLFPGADPMRWWLVPIVAKPAAATTPAYFREMTDSEYEQSFVDFARLHAGSDGYRKGR